jgi:hypothetical protein
MTLTAIRLTTASAGMGEDDQCWIDPAERKGIDVDGETQTPITCSMCGESFDSEDELRTHEAEQHPAGGEQGGDTGGVQRGSAGPGDGMGREQGGGVAGG